MAQQAPLMCVSSDGASSTLKAFDGFPLIDVSWDDADDALERLRPVAVLVLNDAGDDGTRIARLAARIHCIAPYVPLIDINPASPRNLVNCIPYLASRGDFSRLEGRLSAALRVSALHATVLRRSADVPDRPPNTRGDPLQDASVLLLGRGPSYPGLSIALGERLGVIGALSIEAAAKHLNTRDLDGIVIGDEFSPRIVDAFLTVLSEDPRFRNLPIIVTGSAAAFVTPPALPNLDVAPMLAADAAVHALPLIRQHAFEARLNRVLQSLDAGGSLDPRTGLLTQEVFTRNLVAAIGETIERGAGLSAARFVLEPAHDRLRYDAARLFGRLLRKADFATLHNDGSIVVVFVDTDLRTAQGIARRLASVLKHTPHGAGRDKRIDPAVTLVTLLPQDTVHSFRSRLSRDDRPDGETRRAVS